MKTNCKTRMLACTLLAVGTLFLVSGAGASTGDFYPSYEARVVGHVSLPGKAARQMFVQQEGRKELLYIRQASQQGFTVVDVTKPSRPKVVNHKMAAERVTMVDPGLAIAEQTDAGASRTTGNASSNRAGNVPESVRVLDVSNPAHPRTVQTFDGVTSMAQDDARKLILWRTATGSGFCHTRECCAGMTAAHRMRSRRPCRTAIKGGRGFWMTREGLLAAAAGGAWGGTHPAMHRWQLGGIMRRLLSVRSRVVPDQLLL